MDTPDNSQNVEVERRSLFTGSDGRRRGPRQTSCALDYRQI